MTVQERTITFPSERTLGALYLITAGAEKSTWWEKKVGDAIGYVNVPLFGNLHLLVDRLADVSVLSALDGNALTSIDFRQRPVTDLELSSIKDLISVRYLTLPGSPITDRGLMYLVNLTGLSSLDLSNTNVTDEGMEFLLHLKQLRYLYLDGSKVTEQGTARLASHLPRCQIVSRATRTIRF
ncbi:MAG: hypothetical protein KC777_02270, partial [Cyanobacteria bacterium HKST-UBA02]|nr:hypothetical protein [Cyanobacteria bacterium HKST-UBA02]